MDCWVLGCGPSLEVVPIPPNVFTIGVNNSYLVHWSPIYASNDGGAIKRDYGKAGALAYYSAAKLEKYGFTREQINFIGHECYPTCRSGSFAYWLAARAFRASRIFLLGFDMETNPYHFDGRKGMDSYEDTKDALRDHLHKWGVESLIWRQGWVPLEGAL